MPTTTELSSGALASLLDSEGIDANDTAALVRYLTTHGDVGGSAIVEIVNDTESPVTDVPFGRHQPTLLALQASGSTVDTSEFPSLHAIVLSDAGTGLDTATINGDAKPVSVYFGDLNGPPASGDGFNLTLNGGAALSTVLGNSAAFDTVDTVDTDADTVTVNSGRADVTLSSGLHATINDNSARDVHVAMSDGFISAVNINGSGNATISAIGGIENTLNINGSGNVRATMTGHEDTVTDNGTGNVHLTTGGSSFFVNDNSSATLTLDGGDNDELITDSGTGKLVLNGSNQKVFDTSTGTADIIANGSNDVIHLGSGADQKAIARGSGGSLRRRVGNR